MNDPSSRSLRPTPRCVRYRPLLALIHTGTLSPREAAGVNEHLASCPWCREELAAYDALDAAAREHLAGAAFAPLILEDILEDIMYANETSPDANVASTPGASRKLGPTVRGRPHLSRLGPLAAVVVVVVMFAGLIVATHRSGSGATPASGTPEPPSATQTSSTQPANLTQRRWTLTRLMVDGREQPLVPGHAPTLHIGPVNGQGQIDGIYGNGGCNDYDGTYTLSGDTIHLSMRGYTQMFCDATDEENAYFRVLGGIKRYHVEGNTLTLTSADGSVQLTFRAT